MYPKVEYRQKRLKEQMSLPTKINYILATIENRCGIKRESLRPYLEQNITEENVDLVIDTTKKSLGWVILKHQLKAIFGE